MSEDFTRWTCRPPSGSRILLAALMAVLTPDRALATQFLCEFRVAFQPATLDFEAPSLDRAEPHHRYAFYVDETEGRFYKKAHFKDLDSSEEGEWTAFSTRSGWHFLDAPTAVGQVRVVSVFTEATNAGKHPSVLSSHAYQRKDPGQLDTEFGSCE